MNPSAKHNWQGISRDRWEAGIEPFSLAQLARHNERYKGAEIEPFSPTQLAGHNQRWVKGKEAFKLGTQVGALIYLSK